ncbi:cytochrome b [Advenella sp. WQ 585]|uniref:Cytochrome b n=1 Tax=Advenella mandrilli TaxID=2800330 RepID=A0ABS1E8T7_9BURK|nr:cytochrome b [Advenella mandrilli]MBK1780064.1 cytochrome b [Advenella mandrilli]
MNQPYTRTAITLHWLMALGLTGTFALGFYMQDLPLSPAKLQYYAWHKWAGIVMLLLVLVRVVWRITHKAPELPESMSAFMRFMANAAHWVLYALMLAIPLSGWLMSSAQGFQVVWFGVWPLPDLVGKSQELGALLNTVHWALNYFLLAFVIIHACAALKHHFLDKDDILTRMVPVLDKKN